MNKNYKLSDFDYNQNNNFTLIRVLFAWLVLYGHSYAIEKADGKIDPLNQLFQGSIWIGAIAVNGFFIISGYLVTASFVKRGFLNYLISRILRIYPALIFCVILSVFVLGPFSTKVSTIEYFNTSKTYKYLFNSLAFLPMNWYLPGVFQNNSNTSINGSLWSITLEVRCYIILSLIGLSGAFRKRLIFNIILMCIFVFSLFFYNKIPIIGLNKKWAMPSFYFLIGTFCYCNRESIIIDIRVGVLCAVLIFLSFGKPWFVYTFPLAYSYLLFCLAYRTSYLSFEKRIGDISYGIYIYAWPVQQTVAEHFPDFGPMSNTMISTLIVFCLAYFSWKYIETYCNG